ncbi:MAG: hypothetical protein Q4A75_08240 [Peptostreptococcaceae bacterium]|nr:hypothetical protein [Peptostreptococcaceae bacterium]
MIVKDEIISGCHAAFFDALERSGRHPIRSNGDPDVDRSKGEE